jgi:hypothetical protein
VHVADCVTTGRAAAEDISAEKQPAINPKECMAKECLGQSIVAGKFVRRGAEASVPGKLRHLLHLCVLAIRVSRMLQDNLIIF